MGRKDSEIIVIIVVISLYLYFPVSKENKQEPAWPLSSASSIHGMY